MFCRICHDVKHCCVNVMQAKQDGTLVPSYAEADCSRVVVLSFNHFDKQCSLCNTPSSEECQPKRVRLPGQAWAERLGFRITGQALG
jgi:hypothetical protein